MLYTPRSTFAWQTSLEGGVGTGVWMFLKLVGGSQYEVGGCPSVELPLFPHIMVCKHFERWALNGMHAAADGWMYDAVDWMRLMDDCQVSTFSGRPALHPSIHPWAKRYPSTTRLLDTNRTAIQCMNMRSVTTTSSSCLHAQNSKHFHPNIGSMWIWTDLSIVSITGWRYCYIENQKVPHQPPASAKANGRRCHSSRPC